MLAAFSYGRRLAEEGLTGVGLQDLTPSHLEQTSYIAGPSLEILAKYLDEYRQLSAKGISVGVPYWVTLDRYIPKDAVRARWQSLWDWYKAKGHLWVSNGPLYVEEARLVDKIVLTRRFALFTDPAEKWDMFREPKIPKAHSFHQAPSSI